MIIKYYGELTVGKVYSDGNLNDANGKSHPVPFLVLREVTIDDFLKFIKEQHANIGVILKEDRFYEVSVD